MPVAVDATTSPVDYTLATTLKLTGTIAPGDVYVIANTGVPDGGVDNYACPRALR